MMLEKTAIRGDSYFKSPSNKIKVYEMGKTYRTRVLGTKVVKLLVVNVKRKLVNIGTDERKTKICMKRVLYSVDKKNQLDVTFCILYFSSNSCSTCFGQPCAHHQELTTA